LIDLARSGVDSRGNHFALRVDDFDAWERQLASRGMQYLPRKQRPDGAWQLFLLDPDGHVVELFTSPPENSTTSGDLPAVSS